MRPDRNPGFFKKQNQHFAMADNTQKLMDSLNECQNDGILDADTCRRIEDKLEVIADRDRQTARTTMRYVLTSLSGAIVALGVILFISHNWSSLPSSLQLILGFLPLAASGGLAFWFFSTRPRRAVHWREIIPILNILGVISAMSVVGQVYQLQSSLSEFARALILLSALLPFVFNSGAAAAILAVLPMLFLNASAFARSFTVPDILCALLAFGACAGFLSWSHLRGRADSLKSLAQGVLCVTFPLFCLPVIFFERWGEYPVGLLLCLFMSFWGALTVIFSIPFGGVSLRHALPARIPCAVGGILTIFLFLPINSLFFYFLRIRHVNLFEDAALIPFLCAWAVLSAVQIIALCVAFARRNSDKSACVLSLVFLVFNAVAFATMSGLVSEGAGTRALHGASNWLCLVAAFAFMIAGLRRASLARLNIGALILLGYVSLKFVNPHMPLLTWSAIFVALGFILLLLNLVPIAYSRKGNA